MQCLEGLDGFQCAFGQRRVDSSLLELEFLTFTHFQHDELVSDFLDLAQNATTGHDLITHAQATDQVLVFLGPLGLWTPDHQIENDHKTNQKDHAHRVKACRSSARCSLSHGLGDEKTHVELLFYIVARKE